MAARFGTTAGKAVMAGERLRLDRLPVALAAGSAVAAAGPVRDGGVAGNVPGVLAGQASGPGPRQREGSGR
ncbi:MAG: hypothetical protein ACLQDY_10965 [Streptosporangiaceae bacterium]